MSSVYASEHMTYLAFVAEVTVTGTQRILVYEYRILSRSDDRPDLLL